MKHFDKIWRVRSADADLVRTFSEELGVSEVLARLLAGRGFTGAAEVEAFLNPTLDKLLDPFLMKDMKAAVERIGAAVERNERIWIYGDYDVDGITAISLLSRFFMWLGHPVGYYIPDRMEEGYGISEAGVRRVRELGCDLMISVDCGITSVDRVEQAKALGMDVIITDHHEPQAILPDALAVINPKQADCLYPEKSLSGVGIAFKLAQALAPHVMDDPVAQELLQIAALGTVADIVPLVGENRVIVKHGIAALRARPVTGALALMKVSAVDPQKLGTGHIGFMLAPRINASGRIGQPQKGVELLITSDETYAAVLADELNLLNEERQQIEKQIFKEAVAQLESMPGRKSQRVLVVAGEGWHPGVIGIVASRLVERYYRPCILLNLDGDTAKGSARSIEGFNLFEALCSAKELLQKFGGHEMAAGMTLGAAHVDALRTALNTYAEDALTEDDLIPRIHAECVLEARHLQFTLLDDLDTLEPFGPGNPKPVFLYKGLTIDQRRLMGKNQEHVKLVTHDGNRIFEAIGFRWPDPARFKPGQKVDLAFVVERNTFNGVESLQLQMRDSRIRQWELHQTQQLFRRYWASFWHGCTSLAQLPDAFRHGLPDLSSWNPANPENVLNKKTAEPYGKLRICLWTPEAFEELLAQTQDMPPEERIPLFFGRCPAEAPQAIVIHPDLPSLGDAQADTLLFWGKAPVPAAYVWGKGCCKNAGFLYNETAGPATVSILDQLVPSKESLAGTYREIREKGTRLWVHTGYEEAGTDPLALLQEEVRLWILARNGLLREETAEEGIRYTYMPYTGERLNIVESEPYRLLMALKNAVARHMK